MTGARRRPSLLHDCRGAAMTEAAIVVPVFIVLFGLALFIWTPYRAKHDLTAIARLEVWRRALPSCLLEPTDPPRDAAQPDYRLIDRLGLFPTGVRRRVPMRRPALDSIRTDHWESSGSGSVSRPVILGGGSVTVKAHRELECNETSRDVESDLFPVIMDVFCRVGGGGSCPAPTCEVDEDCTDEPIAKLCLLDLTRGFKRCCKTKITDPDGTIHGKDCV